MGQKTQVESMNVRRSLKRKKMEKVLDISKNTGLSGNIANANKLETEKKKKKRIGSICTAECKFEIVKQTAKKLGMKNVHSTDVWNVYWTDYTVPLSILKELKKFQKVNHIPGMLEVCRKDRLARNLNRMLKIFPKDYNIFPKTWCLPTDYSELLSFAKIHKGRTFIVKPDVGCRGQGIRLTKNVKDIAPYRKLICQVYIERPLLIDGYKFDLRLYTLITSCDPLRIFVYNEGLARFATSPYKLPSHENISNMYMHITNYSVNKHSKTFVNKGEEGSKRRISTLNKWLERQSYDVEKIWESIDEAIVKTILAIYPTLKHSYLASFRAHSCRQACFELLGFDIILSKNSKPYILEVNQSPSFHTDSKIDREVKEALLIDTFNILNLTCCERKKVIREEKKNLNGRLFYPKVFKENIKEDINVLEQERGKQIKWEESNLGNFRRIYPSTYSSKYDPFLKESQMIGCQGTLTSRFRVEIGRIFREELDVIKRGTDLTNKNQTKTEERIISPPQNDKKPDLNLLETLSFQEKLNGQSNLKKATRL